MNKIIKQAFTLIELLVVIAIIGILSGLIVISISGVTQKATIAKAQVFSNSLRNSLMLNIQAQYSFDDVTDYNTTTKVLNSTVGNVPDSWADNEGRAYGGPILKGSSDCVSGYCLSFDGADDYVSLSQEISLSGEFTLSFWANRKNNTTYDMVTKMSGTGIKIGFSVGSDVCFIRVIDGGNADTSVGVVSSKWNLINITRNSSNKIDYYLNADPAIRIFSNIAQIGSFQMDLISDTEHYFNGSIDEIRIYNAVIPTSQIKEQYYTGLNKLLINGGITREEYQSKILDLNNRYGKR